MIKGARNDELTCYFNTSMECHGEHYKTCTDCILDQIRKEVEALPKTYPFINHFDMYVKVSDVMKIIDKYKAESEGKNDSN